MEESRTQAICPPVPQGGQRGHVLVASLLPPSSSFPLLPSAWTDTPMAWRSRIVISHFGMKYARNRPLGIIMPDRAIGKQTRSSIFARIAGIKNRVKSTSWWSVSHRRWFPDACEDLHGLMISPSAHSAGIDRAGTVRSLVSGRHADCQDCVLLNSIHLRIVHVFSQKALET